MELTNVLRQELEEKMAQNKLVYVLSSSSTIPGEWESRLIYQNRMLAYSSAETGGNIFPKPVVALEAETILSEYGLHTAKDALLVIVADDYDDFLHQLSEIDDSGTRNILYPFFRSYGPYIVSQL